MNVLTAVLALVGNLFYVVVYTGYLKRSTDQNIVIGGAAGAVPPLVGYAAATGKPRAPGALAVPDRVPLDAAALLGARTDAQGALRGRERADAARDARRGARRRARSCSTRSCSSASRSSVGIWLGPLYTVAAALLGAYFVVPRWRLRRDASRRNAVVLFHYSLAYLALLFVAAAVDPLML